MSAFTLILTLVFVMITISISMWRKLGLEKDIAWGTVRGVIQLFLVGYVLQFVFQTEHPLLTLLIIVIMISVASWNAAKRGKGLKGIFWRILVSIAATETVTMTLLIGLQVIEATPKYIIPITGILMGNAMVVSGLFLNSMNREVQQTVGLVQLPGMMTGMIVAGADPIEAVRYQILIMLIASCSAAITSIVLSMLSYRLWFTKDLRLR
jgi:putative ABC transport system permease protein